MITAILPNQLSYDVTNDKFKDDITKTQAIRYLKGIYHTKKEFEKKFLSRLNGEPVYGIREFLRESYDDAKIFTYKEAFEIKNDNFRAAVFSTVDITEMIEELGCERIKVAGKHVVRKKFSKKGNYLGTFENDNIYETYKVFGEKLGLPNDVYALKVWCTTTNKEHWLWIDEKYKDDPLEAVASTFRIHENLISHIKELKRQGDIMLVEMKKEIEPKGNIVPLTAEQYFGLLTTES